MHHQIRYLVFGESVAQQVEHNTFNVGVPGSSPGGFTKSKRQSSKELCLFIYLYPLCKHSPTYWPKLSVSLLLYHLIKLLGIGAPLIGTGLTAGAEQDKQPYCTDKWNKYDEIEPSALAHIMEATHRHRKT